MSLAIRYSENSGKNDRKAAGILVATAAASWMGLQQPRSTQRNHNVLTGTWVRFSWPDQYEGRVQNKFWSIAMVCVSSINKKVMATSCVFGLPVYNHCNWWLLLHEGATQVKIKCLLHLNFFTSYKAEVLDVFCAVCGYVATINKCCLHSSLAYLHERCYAFPFHM